MYLKNIRGNDEFEKTIEFDNKSSIPDSKAFWSAFIAKLFGIHASNKSLEHFLERLVMFKKTNSLDPIKIELNKSIQVQLKKHYRDQGVAMSFVETTSYSPPGPTKKNKFTLNESKQHSQNGGRNPVHEEVQAVQAGPEQPQVSDRSRQ
jgi:hypothetical protein